VACVYVGRFAGEPCVGQIGVATAHGGVGIVTALLRRVIDEARRRGEAAMVLNTQSDVAWNRPWYEHHGFVVVAPSAWSEPLVGIALDRIWQGRADRYFGG
jgi:predicted N-acetyltransferase YhbS